MDDVPAASAGFAITLRAQEAFSAEIPRRRVRPDNQSAGKLRTCEMKFVEWEFLNGTRAAKVGR